MTNLTAIAVLSSGGAVAYYTAFPWKIGFARSLGHAKRCMSGGPPLVEGNCSCTRE
jgi:hypothetical protein